MALSKSQAIPSTVKPTTPSAMRWRMFKQGLERIVHTSKLTGIRLQAITSLAVSQSVQTLKQRYNRRTGNHRNWTKRNIKRCERIYGGYGYWPKERWGMWRGGFGPGGSGNAERS